ncbi:amidohydrolase family protein [Burkholderia oklahomensis]|uniref:amidohydrolase family protein n=1 Tax=Burkholderia oklahomensis TaxID=342113 RepID=UPI00016A7FEF|nr:amidohydrolase family protein [Burkholderia oklahomensis]AJX35736.1 amidohydrolase family protein [Burkholderia oklahomensis C6786]AOI49309.1 amidohydrolase [Burkholderia oklahomensis C6786]KUY60644.1 amidohydrolase [Burkholderia oklahomensis C6786]MBI0362439.1 amidohydrolase family protein [Burkholderia oklahomensis]SUY26549.1 Predicted metal-dependent hydrolase of the TIM-barrel fold [Burkholderia oklahomensis]
MSEIIDAHQHYWDPARGDYGWLTPALAPLYRPFGPADLAPLRAAAGVARTIVVQAAPTVDETRYLLDLARRDASIAGVVGWAPLDAKHAPDTLAALARDPSFKGVRPMLQDLLDAAWIADPALTPAIDALVELDLAFDALVTPRHLAPLATFARRFPRLRLVVDHGAKPPIHMGRDGWQPWADGIAALAALPNVHCKLSGLATEAAHGWNRDTLARHVDHLFDVFGATRMIWGSDWPVLNLNGDYASWHAAAHALTVARFGESACDAVFGANAAAFYRL